MNFSNILQEVFNIEENNTDINILRHLKRDGYVYLIQCWKRIERIRKNMDTLDESKIDSYFDTYLKIYLIENDLHKGLYEYIDKLCNQSNNEIYTISLEFFYKFVNNLEYNDLEEFILNIVGIINIINIKKYTLQNLIEFYNIIIKYPKVCEIIIKSDKWLFDNAFQNENNSYLGKLISKVDFFKPNWNNNINLLCNIFTKLLNSNIKNNIYKWLITSITHNKSKITIANTTEILFSNNLLINIFYILKNELTTLTKTTDFYTSIDISYYKLETKLLENDSIDILTANKNSIIFFLTYWYFVLGPKYIINNYELYKKEINYIDQKIYDISNSNWWNEHHDLRIQYISKLKKKKNYYKKTNNEYNKFIDNNEAMNSYVDVCNIIAETILQNDNLFNNNEMLISLLDSLIILKNNYDIKNNIDLIIKILDSNNQLLIKYKCIELLVNYIPTYGIQYIEYSKFQNNIVHLLIKIFNDSEFLQNEQFYDKYEPRYHISFFLRFLTNHTSYKDTFINLLNISDAISEKFITYIINDISELFYEIIYHFEKIDNLYNKLHNEVSIESEDDYTKVSKLLETFTTFLNEKIIMLEYIFNQINIFTISQNIIHKIEKIILHLLRKIIINSTNYSNIITMNKINLDLYTITIKILYIIINLYKSNDFKNYLHEQEQCFSKNIFTLIKKEHFTDAIKSWYIYYNLLQLEYNINESKIIEKEIPDKYLDPLLNTLITSPVILPESKIIIDIETIKKHLETHKDDPFNRTPLTIDQLLEYNNTDDIKEKLTEFIKEVKNYQ